MGLKLHFGQEVLDMHLLTTIATCCNSIIAIVQSRRCRCSEASQACFSIGVEQQGPKAYEQIRMLGEANEAVQKIPSN